MSREFLDPLALRRLVYNIKSELSKYAKRTEIPSKLSELENDAGYVTESPEGEFTETDPTVPSWAKEPNKPNYTADEVGTYTKEEVDAQVNLVREAAEQAQNDASYANTQISQVESRLNEDITNVAMMKADKSNTYTKQEVEDYVGTQTEILKADIEGIQEDLHNEAHFRGYLSTNAKIQALEATPNDFAYSAESGTKWVYDSENGWQDTGVPVPDQLTPASESTPLMNGTASVGVEESYARGDHRHPTDTTRLGVEEFNEFKSELEFGLDRIIAIQNSLIGGGSE